MCDVIGRADSLRISALPVNIKYARPVVILDHPRIRGMSSGGRWVSSIGFQPPRGSRRAAPLFPKQNGSIIVPSVFRRRPDAIGFQEDVCRSLFGVSAHLHTAEAFRLPQRNVPDEWIFSCQCASEVRAGCLIGSPAAFLRGFSDPTIAFHL